MSRKCHDCQMPRVHLLTPLTTHVSLPLPFTDRDSSDFYLV